MFQTTNQMNVTVFDHPKESHGTINEKPNQREKDNDPPLVANCLLMFVANS